MNTSLSVGEPLDSQLLYERQKELRESRTYPPGPTIVAAGLETPENLGSVLRLADAAGSPRVIFIPADERTTYPLKRIHRTARNTETLLQWELWTQEQFLERHESLPPLIAV